MCNKNVFLSTILFLLFVPCSLLAQVTLEKEVKITDIAYILMVKKFLQIQHQTRSLDTIMRLVLKFLLMAIVYSLTSIMCL